MNDSSKKILLIEDEDFIRDIYKRQLTLAGFLVDAERNGRDGLAKATTSKYDLVLLDVMLPDMNGLDILKHLKNDDATKYLQVVLLTNLGQESVLKEGMSIGAKGYLIKASYTPNQLVEEVKKIL